MVPVTISNTGVVTVADITTSWYNYTNKQWANAVVLNSGATVPKAGNTIPAANIKAYYVWVPRYKYKLFSATGLTSIEIVFENKKTTKSAGTATGEYRTHPAFTFGTQELNGIWVGKFETTGTVSSPTVLLNLNSLRSQKVSSHFSAATWWKT